MRNLMRTLVASLALAAAAPAVAQYTFTQPGQQPQPVQRLELWNNVARVNLGVGFYNSGWANCYSSYWGYPYTAYCTSGSYTSYIPFLVGPQIDFNLQGMNNISVGFTVALGSVSTTVYNNVTLQDETVSTNVTLWEPTIDYVAKFGPPSQDTVGRFRIGGGMYIGPNSTIGGAFRIGGGASFLNANRIGVGLDLVLEAGGLNGQWVGGLQLIASPEFHF
jgi:acetyltransferase-like isoleucine patch superfamily enzyme